MLRTPNDTLAVEYIRAIREAMPQAALLAVPRMGAPHDAPPAALTGQEAFASASQLRALLLAGRSDEAFRYIPEPAQDTLRRELRLGRAPATLAALDVAVLAQLRRMTPEDFARLPDVSEGLENRLYTAVRRATSLDALYAFAKAKRYTHARIRRLVLAAFLGLTREDVERPVPYLRVLGHNERGREMLRRAKETARLPVILRGKEAFSLDKAAADVYIMECRAADLYALAFPAKQACGLEQTAQVVAL